MKIIFKNLPSSALVRKAITERLSPILEKVSPLRRPVTVTVERENSPAQPGPDRYTTTLMIGSGARGSLRLTESAENLYRSIALLAGTSSYALRRAQERRKPKYYTAIEVT
jgi:hypothetical protein